MARLRSFVLLCSFLPSLLHQGAAVAIPLNSTGPDSTTNSTIRINATFRPRNLDKLRANISAGHSIRPKPAHANQPLFYPSAVPNATAQEIQDARELVAAAHASQAAYNTYQLANPRRNMYGPEDPAASRVKRDDQVPMPTLSVEVQQAVKLVSHVDDSIRHQNGTLLLPISHELPPQYQDQGPTSSFKPSGSPTKRTASDFWMENVDHYWDAQPFGGDTSYKVWRNVADYGAVGDGVTDDTDAINLAISDGNRCGVNCLSSTVKGALVYFPLGTYRVTSPIISYYDTQLVGAIDPSTGDMPTILAGSSFTGFGVISTDIYLSDGVSEWYINQSNFYRQVRNFNIDLRQATMYNIAGIHWVGQATSIQNVWIYMTDKSTSSQVGIWAENGSGGFIGDIVFSGGLYGILCGNQQFTATFLVFQSCKNAIGLIWDWAWTWSQLLVVSCEVAINMNPPGASASDPAGSIYLVDSDFVTNDVFIKTFPFQNTEQGTTVFTFDNLHYGENGEFIQFPDGSYLDFDGGTDSYIDLMTIGDIEINGVLDGFYYLSAPDRPAALTGTGASIGYPHQWWQRRPKPTYQDVPAGDFLNAMDYAWGDGVTDDTETLQQLLYYCADEGLILWIPSGSYMISSSILVPTGSYIVGEAWSQLVAYGSYFADENDPQPLIVVGEGTGDVEMQDLLFTSVGALPGLVLLYWDMAAASSASAAMWDCHFRVGGAIGTELQVAQCPKLTGTIQSQCIAATAMIIMPSTSNGYFENVWLWVADHDIDDAANTQIDIYVARGWLIYSQGPSWLWGTASEHAILYQYNVNGAQDIFMSMIQTETPYFQGAPSTQAPEPFQLLWGGDPQFDMCGTGTVTCNAAWALIVQDSSSVFINGAGLYSWFANYDQDCVGTQSCQQRLVNIANAASLRLNHLITIGSVETLTPAIANEVNTIIMATDVTQALVYPWWTAIAAYLDSIDSTVSSRPIRTGWVAFGDSMASGIGAGVPWDSDAPCNRGTGSYPVILNDLFETFWGFDSEFQFNACSGQKASHFFLDSGKGRQYAKWNPATSDIATIQFFGNDALFGDVIRTCILGTDSSLTCDQAIQNSMDVSAAGNTYIDEFFQQIMGQITYDAAQNGKPRFQTYWIGYPSYFDLSDNTCDNDYFWIWPPNYFWWRSGQYLTLDLRRRMNEAATQLNDRLFDAVLNWNRNLPYRQATLIEPDWSAWEDQRFCEPGVTEPQASGSQGSVAFFYPNGPDQLDSSYTLPPPLDGAIGGWDTLSTISSADCESDDDLADSILYTFCELAIDLKANPGDIGGINAQMATDGDTTFDAVLLDDGNVAITSIEQNYRKIFHMKSKWNLAVARLVTNSLRWN